MIVQLKTHAEVVLGDDMIVRINVCNYSLTFF